METAEAQAAEAHYLTGEQHQPTAALIPTTQHFYRKKKGKGETLHKAKYQWM